MTDEAVERAITPTESPEVQRARAVLDNPYSSKNQRHKARLLLNKLTPKPKPDLPPLVRDFYALLERLTTGRRAGFTPGQLKYLWVGYEAGRLHRDALPEEGSREALSADEIPMPQSLVETVE